MRILLLITQLELAGAQKAIFELAQGLTQAGHVVVVVTCYDKANYGSLFAKRYGIEIVSLQMKNLLEEPLPNRLWRLLQGLWLLFVLLKQREIQILQSYTHYSNWIGAVIGRLAHVPHCVTSQRGPLGIRSKWAARFDRWINNSWLVDRMIAVSQATLEECLTNGIHPQKLLVIRNGVDFDRYATAPTESALVELRTALRIEATDFVVLTVARLHPQKGHSILLDAARMVVDQAPTVKFIWVGEGELEQELLQKRAEIGLDAHVLMVGAQSQVELYYSLADIFVLASHWEGLPNVLLEAVSARLPIIATDVGGVREVVSDDRGRLVPAQSPKALAEALLALLSPAEVRHQLAERAYAYVHGHFVQASTLQAYLHVYHELIGN